MTFIKPTIARAWFINFTEALCAKIETKALHEGGNTRLWGARYRTKKSKSKKGYNSEKKKKAF